MKHLLTLTVLLLLAAPASSQAILLITPLSVVTGDISDFWVRDQARANQVGKVIVTYRNLAGAVVDVRELTLFFDNQGIARQWVAPWVMGSILYEYTEASDGVTRSAITSVPQ